MSARTRPESGAALLALVLLGCGGEPTASVPPPPVPPDFPRFSLTVETRTTGPNPDPDGYVLGIDSIYQTVATNATVTQAGVGPGGHMVRLFGLSTNCRIPIGPPIGSPMPQDESWDVEKIVDVPERGARELFDVKCYELGTLNLVVLSTANPQVSQFEVLMSHDPRRIRAGRGVNRISDVSVGPHTLWVRGQCLVGFDVVSTRPVVDTVTIDAIAVATDTVVIRQACQ